MDYMKRGVKCLESKEYKKAYAEFEQAADFGCSNAMYNLAISHLTGLGAAIDTVQAKEFLNRAIIQMNDAAVAKMNELTSE